MATIRRQYRKFRYLTTLKICFLCVTLYISIFIIYVIRFQNPLERKKKDDLESQPMNVVYRSPSSYSKGSVRSAEITVALVSCGRSRDQEVFNAIKSAIVFTVSPLRLLIFTEDIYVKKFRSILEIWQLRANHSFTFEILLVTFPKSENDAEWRRLLVHCASQRLFLPSILKDVDSLLVVDVDVLFLSSVEETWVQFNLMNETQEVAMATECDFPHGGYYEQYARHPYYGSGGLNSGVMLMNLTRMRSSHWTRRVVEYYHQYKDVLVSGDQDIINIYLYFNPDRVFVLPARFNFRVHNCETASLGLRQTEDLGVAILHGTAWAFFKGRPFLSAIFKCWTEYQLGFELHANLYLPLIYQMNSSEPSRCRKVQQVFVSGLLRLMSRIETPVLALH